MSYKQEKTEVIECFDGEKREVSHHPYVSPCEFNEWELTGIDDYGNDAFTRTCQLCGCTFESD